MTEKNWDIFRNYRVGLNITLGISKFLIGILVNSMCLVHGADSVNNFRICRSILPATVLGFKFSSAPPDKDHPYGHGRVEYVTTLIISMIMLVGFQFFKIFY